MKGLKTGAAGGIDERLEVTARKHLRELAAKHGLPVLPVTSTLSMAMRLIPGGRRQFLEYIQLACLAKTPDGETGQPDALRWWAVWEGLAPSARTRVTLDEVCFAAGVTPKAIVQVVAGLAFDLNCDLGDFISAVDHPQVVAKTIEIAKTAQGTAERRMLLDHAGFLPQPKGMNLTLSQRVANMNVTGPAPMPGLPNFADDIRALEGPVGAVQQQLEAGVKPADLAIDGEVLVKERVCVPREDPDV
jgi:hypothetical protein